jgi:uncharacterized protein YjbJ (UPF0337 family)
VECAFASRFGSGSDTISGVFNSAQTSEKPQDYNVDSPQNRQSGSRGPRRNMKSSTEEMIKGGFHEVKGKIVEEIGKVTNNRDMKDEGKAEKKAGEVQQKMGETKEAVKELRGELKELKKA